MLLFCVAWIGADSLDNSLKELHGDGSGPGEEKARVEELVVVGGLAAEENVSVRVCHHERHMLEYVRREPHGVRVREQERVVAFEELEPDVGLGLH